MTVPSAPTTFRYEGNGVTTVFAYSNRLLTTSDVQVQILTRSTDAIVETLALTTDYSVTIVSNSLANITITNPAKIPSVTQDILLNLDLAITQTRSFPRADSLPAADIELGLDKLTLIQQILEGQQERSLRFPPSDTNTDGELPPKAERALAYLAFDANGAPIASMAEIGGAPAGAFGATLVATGTQAAAKSLLDITFTAASSVTPAYQDFAEDTDNGANRVRVIAPTSLASDVTVTLPSATGTIALTSDAPTNPAICNGRLTLTSGLPVTTADVTGATTIYFTPYKGNKIALYSGTAWVEYTFTELSLALGTLISGRPYDVFCYNNAGTPTLEFTAWTNDTTRATALAYQNGVLCRTGALTRRYLGTFYTTATTTTEDSARRRLLFNYYNNVRRTLSRVDATGAWTYTTATWRQANAAALNQVEIMRGVDEKSVSIEIVTSAGNGGGTTVDAAVGIGIDSTTVPSTDVIMGGSQLTSGSAPGVPVFCKYEGMLAVGRRTFVWLEISKASGTTTWYNAGGGTFSNYAGIRGSVWA